MRGLETRQWLALALSAAALMLLWLAFSGEESPSRQPPAPAAAYPERDWNEPRQRQLNISLYTFFDRDRNGRFDGADLPMAAVAVRLSPPGASGPTHRSNINGFANFDMSWQDENADIRLADEDYGLEVLVPPGWINTTGNTEQTLRLQHAPGSVTGLGSERPPAPVGLAPVLSVTGRVTVADEFGEDREADDIRLVAVDSAGRQLVLHPDASGAYSFEAQPGGWQVRAESPPGSVTRVRRFQVFDAPVRLSTLAAVEHEREALPVVVPQDFEFLVRSDIGKLPGGTGGLDWDYLVAVDNQLYNGPGFVNVLRSGANVGYNSSGHPVTITPGPGRRYFDFVGAWFAAAWPASEGEILMVEAWRGEESVAREEITLSHLGPVWFDADFRRIDKLRLATRHFWPFVTDDMVFRLEEAAAQPAPGR